MFGERIPFKQSDLEAIKILNDFLPEHIFDAHAHLLDRENGGLEAYRKMYGRMLANPKTLYMNMIPYPEKSMADLSNGKFYETDLFIIKQLEKDRENVGELFVHPEETYDDLKKRLVHPRIRGLKCYHLFAKREETGNCDIGEYLPEHVWELANERKLCLTIHLVKDKALADEENLNYICRMANRYPDAILILAHAARSFASWTGIESVEKVAHLENVWFDFSAVCESPAMFQILKKVGVSRCMWGSDYPITLERGKVISLGNGFYWLYQKEIESCSSWLIGIENLMAVRQASIMAELTRSEIEDLFYHNAVRLFKIGR